MKTMTVVAPSCYEASGYVEQEETVNEIFTCTKVMPNEVQGNVGGTSLPVVELMRVFDTQSDMFATLGNPPADAFVGYYYAYGNGDGTYSIVRVV